MTTELTAVDFLTRTVDRNRYFYGKLMTVRDFLREQEYFNSKRWLINRLLFGGGIVCGLEVSKAGGADSPTLVEIRPGLAFDPLGREVTVLEAARVELSKVVSDKTTKGLPAQGAAEAELLVCLNYYECPKEPVPSLGGSPCAESCESNRVGETYTVTLIPAPAVAKAPTSCERWLNRQTVTRDSANFHVERVAPVWVRQGEVFEVAVKVEALNDVAGVTLNETVAGGALVEPNPTPPSQFPTTPVSLRRGEFFIYVYQVQAPGAGAVTINSASAVPTDQTEVEVIDPQTAEARDRERHLGPCPEDPEEQGVPVARVKATFDSKKLTAVKLVPDAEQPHFRYSLTQVADLMDCVRASLRADAASQRPGHLFITFKDVEREDLQPIGAAADHGSKWTVTRGDHRHALLLYQDSGLQFVGDEFRIEGNVGGEAIRFLRPVWGQYPVEPRHLATKEYVDASIAGLDWQESVRSYKVATPPAESKPGDRYLIPGNPGDMTKKNARGWPNHPGHVATYDGETWDYTKPDEGTAVFVEDEGIAYLFVKEKWIPFLATPEVAAGMGLYNKDAALNVGQGAGLKVNANDVEVVYEPGLPQPVGPVPSAGTTAAASRGDHAHRLPLTPNGGLAFGPLEAGAEDNGSLTDDQLLDLKNGLHINGNVGGANISFLHPVWGVDPSEPGHLATKHYVDRIAAGLDWQNSVLDKDRWSPPAEPPPGARYLVAPEPIVKANVSSLPLPRNPWRGHADSIATWSREDGWTFKEPDEGTAVFVEDENMAYLFVERRWVPFLALPEVAAGMGLYSDGARLSVGQGSGLLVTDDGVEVAYHAADPEPVGQTAFGGASTALARGDHTHALPLAQSGGLEFAAVGKEGPGGNVESIIAGDETDGSGGVLQLRINGNVSGESISFLHPVSGRDPSDPTHLATKQYVDGVAAGLTWQRTVLDKDLSKPPDTKAQGDRYLLFTEVVADSAWGGQQDNIATWTGRRWEFTPPVEGMAAFVADENLAYLYADKKWIPFLAPPAAVGAGDGLVQKENDLYVGQGAGVVVTADAVSVNFGGAVPQPVGKAGAAGSSGQAAQSDHTHALPLATASGLEFVTAAATGTQLRVNGQVGGTAIDFLSPVLGQNPTDPRHLATKQYVDSKGGGAVAAGDGLVNNANGVSIVGGPGLVVTADEVHVNFENVTARPLGANPSPGSSNTVARGDHVHPMPDVWGMNVSTGVVSFNMQQAGQVPHVATFPIDPGLGGGAIAVVLGLESETTGEGTMVGDVEPFQQAMFEGGSFRPFPPVQLAAVVLPPGAFKFFKNSTFEIWAQATREAGVLPPSFRVRWWAYRPGNDYGVTDYTPSAPPLADR